MTLHALFRHPDLYRAGMSVAPVPNMRLYDTIYQERYMGLPSANADGYRNGSPITWAHQLKGHLLVVHGTGDDNVHYQGTEALLNELVAHNKTFDMMAYPNRSHGISEGKGTTRHLYGLLTRYLTNHVPTHFVLPSRATESRTERNDVPAMPRKTALKPAKAAPAIGPYSQGVRIGDLLFCAGQIPLDPAAPSAPLPEGIQAQTARVIRNIELILEDQGLTLANVVKSTVFMVNLGDFAAMNEVYARHFTGDCPARSTIQVAALPRGALVEIEVIAHY
jgi:reactive intermediate/imine deaminase